MLTRFVFIFKESWRIVLAHSSMYIFSRELSRDTRLDPQPDLIT